MTIPISSLSDKDKERCRYHLGYIETSFAASLQFGLPKPTQMMFMVEQALQLLVNAHAIERVLCILDTLDSLEVQIRGATKTLAAEKLGDLTLRSADAGKTYPDLLEREYVRWAKRLADIFGVPLYPFAGRFQNASSVVAGPIPIRRS